MARKRQKYTAPYGNYDPDTHDPDSVYFRDTYVGPSERDLMGGCNRCGGLDDCYCIEPEPIELGTLPPWWVVTLTLSNGHVHTERMYHYHRIQTFTRWILDAAKSAALIESGVKVRVQKYAEYRGASLLMSDRAIG